MTVLAIIAIAIPLLIGAAVFYRVFRDDLAGLAFVFGVTLLIVAAALAFSWGITYLAGALG